MTSFRESNANKVNAITKPKMIPNGRLRSPETEAARTIGNTGKIQGEAINANPSRNDKPISIRLVPILNSWLKRI